MEYKICPICDQKMTKPHYCDHCRQRIRNPLTIDVNYYLNERHPDAEHDCSFHDYDDPAYNMQPNTWQPSRQTVSGQSSGQTVSSQPVRRAVPNQSARQSVPNQPRRAAKTAKTSRAGDRTALIVSVIIIFVIAVSVISVFLSLFNTMLKGTSEGGAFPGAVSLYPSENSLDELLEQWNNNAAGDPEEDKYESWELDEADVIAAGVNCSSYGHFHVTGEQMSDELVAFLSDMGYSVESDDVFTSNTEDSYGYTSFNRYDSFYFGSGTSMEIRSDTATNQLHSINISWSGADETIQIAEKITAILRASGDWSLSEADTAAWLDDLKRRLPKLEYEDVTPEELSYSVYVFVSSYESNGYYISFSNWGD